MRVMVIDPRKAKESAWYMVVDDGVVAVKGMFEDLQDLSSDAMRLNVKPGDVLVDCSRRRQEVHDVCSIGGFQPMRKTRPFSTGDVVMDGGNPVLLIKERARGGMKHADYGHLQDCHDAAQEYIAYKRNLDDAGVVPAPISFTIEQKAERYDRVIAQLYDLAACGKPSVARVAGELLRDVK